MNEYMNRPLKYLLELQEKIKSMDKYKNKVKSINLYNHQGRKKLDKISWAIYYRLKEKRKKEEV